MPNQTEEDLSESDRYQRYTLRDGASSGEDNPTPEALPRSYTYETKILHIQSDCKIRL